MLVTRLVNERDEFAKRDVRNYIAFSSDADHRTEVFAYYKDLHPAQGTVSYSRGGLATYHYVRFELAVYLLYRHPMAAGRNYGKISHRYLINVR